MTQIKSKGVTKACATLFIGLCASTCIYTLCTTGFFFVYLFLFFYVVFPLSISVYVTLIFYYILNHF